MRVQVLLCSLSWGAANYANISHHPDIDKTCLYAKDPHEVKYQFLISKRENTGLKHLNGSKAFVEYSNDLDDTWRIEPKKEKKNIDFFMIWYA